MAPPEQALRVQVHLVDATYELFRAHFGRPSARDPEGREVGATVGLIESLFSVVREPGVTHVGCATDHVIRSWRNERWPGYKTEAGVAPELLAQFPLAEDAMRAAGFVVWPMVEFEADDALATAAARFADEPGVERVVILSPDKDMAQCVREDGRVVTYDRRRGRAMDAAAVREKFGVAPASVPDLLALVGDAADGFPGIPGWGAKWSAAVLARHGHLDAIPDDPAAWDVPLPRRTAARLSASLRDRWDHALLFRELALLRLDVPLGEPLENLRWEGVPRQPFEALARRLGARHLIARVPRWAPG
jgi:5'-3' exonuclease